MFDSLVSSLYPDICSQDDVASVFRVVPNPDPTNFMLLPIIHLCRIQSIPTSIFGIQTYVPSLSACYQRRKYYGIAATTCRPPFCVLILLYSLKPYASCVVRRSQMIQMIPRENCVTNFSGSMMMLHTFLVSVFCMRHVASSCYFEGYTCEACMMTIVAITAPSASASGKPKIKDLVRIDLSFKRQHIHNIFNLINIAYILSKLVARVCFRVKDFASFARYAFHSGCNGIK